MSTDIWQVPTSGCTSPIPTPGPRQSALFTWPRQLPVLMPLPGFRLKELEAIALIAAAGHEVMRAAARLAGEGQIERRRPINDSVSRHPYARTGELMNKTGLLDKPEKI